MSSAPTLHFITDLDSLRPEMILERTTDKRWDRGMGLLRLPAGTGIIAALVAMPSGVHFGTVAGSKHAYEVSVVVDRGDLLAFCQCADAKLVDPAQALEPRRLCKHAVALLMNHHLNLHS
jgi:hypothetical protein